MMYKDYIEIGYIPDAHGIHGQVKVRMEVQDINDYKKLKSVFLAKKGAKPTLFNIEKISFKNSSEGIIALQKVETREAAEELIGSTLFISEDQLPKLEEGQFYYFEVIGFRINDVKLGELGTIEDILEMPGNDIIVMNYQNKEVLIPIVFAGAVDKPGRILNVTLPEGLLETYLS
ncbi:MAG: ribosome maturation factor RimM [Bacteroidia bacterium]|nr:ribosome maturation factor RimM [Bacteroidia bacterium]